MNELNNKEILEILYTVFTYFKSMCDMKTRERINQAQVQIRTLVKKPRVTEEWTEEKAEKLCNNTLYGHIDYCIYHEEIKEFLRTLIDEIEGK